MKPILFVILFLLPQILWSQWVLSPGLHLGAITNHTTKLTIDNKGLSAGLGLNIQYQTTGKKNWEVYHKYPVPGLEITAFWLSDYDQLGYAVGILPNISLKAIQRESWNFYTTIGFGVAWLSKHYDPVTNPDHNAIGSHLNNYTAVRVFGRTAIREKLDMTIGLSFAHFSNGTSSLPNYGLNLPAVNLGLSYLNTRLTNDDYKSLSEQEPYRKWGFFLELTGARQEKIAIGGPKYPIFTYAASITRKLNPVHRSFVGYEYEYNYAIFNFYKLLEQFPIAEETRNTGKRNIMVIGHEFLFGDVGLGAQLGFYVGQYQQMIPRAFYNKLNLKYYIHPFGKKYPSIYLGLHMKAHLIDAEYISAGIGIQY